MIEHHPITEVHTPVAHLVVMNIPCPSCKAQVGDPCRRGDGELLQNQELPVSVHVSRLAPIWVVYRIGYQHGRRNQEQEFHP